MNKLTGNKKFYQFLSQFYWFLFRVANKMHFLRIRDKIERSFIDYSILSASNDMVIAMIGDKSHKLLQEGLGQEIKNNQYFLA